MPSRSKAHELSHHQLASSWFITRRRILNLRTLVETRFNLLIVFYSSSSIPVLSRQCHHWCYLGQPQRFPSELGRPPPTLDAPMSESLGPTPRLICRSHSFYPHRGRLLFLHEAPVHIGLRPPTCNLHQYRPSTSSPTTTSRASSALLKADIRYNAPLQTPSGLGIMGYIFRSKIDTVSTANRDTY